MITVSITIAIAMTNIPTKVPKITLGERHLSQTMSTREIRRKDRLTVTYTQSSTRTSGVLLRSKNALWFK